MKRNLEAAIAARKDLEGKLDLAEGETRRISQELERESGGRAEEKQQLITLSGQMERIKSSLEQETLRRQESEDQLRDALSQQQQLDQDLERFVSETKILHADLTTERRMHEAVKKQVQTLADQVSVLSREKLLAEQAAADLKAEIDQARVALADDPGDDRTVDTNPAGDAGTKSPSGPLPFHGVKKEAEIIKKRSLIVKGANIPVVVHPLSRSMVTIDEVKVPEPEKPQIKSVEDLFEDDEDERKHPSGDPVVSIIQEPASEPVQDVLPDRINQRSAEQGGFFEDERVSLPDSGSTFDEDEMEDGDSIPDDRDAEPVSGQNIAFNRTQWLDLLKWAHHCDALSPDQRMQIVRMGRLIQKGRKLTRKQEEQVLEMVALVQSLGYRIS
jgi:hypothetical protein